ncbi:MAG: hypothetical protein Q7J27_02660 [Syntrophales bacterium]|nr:hypothetical protein [Syntrophales bacterium]
MLQVTAAILIKDNKLLIAKRPADDKLLINGNFLAVKLKMGKLLKSVYKGNFMRNSESRS